jgi:deoxyribodipyrimidine photo-lyase
VTSPSSTTTTIVWFREDLRIADNPALAAAAFAGAVVPLYILDEGPGIRPLGGAARWWLDKSLRALDADLAALGAPLVLRRGDPADILGALARETGAGAVVWNRLYDPAAVARDSALTAALRSQGLEVASYNASLLVEPWEARTGAGQPYRVFTPFWRAVWPLAEAAARPLPRPAALTPHASPAASERLEAWRLQPSAPDWSAGFSSWRPGEAGAQARLDTFLARAAGAYGEQRDLPGLESTSRLSPHLRFGEIGPRQVWAAARMAQLAGEAAETGIEAFLRELGWREFNRHLQHHFPALPDEGFDPRFAAFAWVEDDDGLARWRRGLTGYPIVDAGMRELWTTGWMHNRVRMIAASFLVKDLLIHWKHGESWFWDTLLDADLSNNIGGWQWVAGLGADAAPYFRVFNPTLQGEKFDPAGDYVRRWVPELARLPRACIHQPWRGDQGVLAAAGVTLGRDYPHPIVDHAAARNRAPAAYEGLR